MLWKKDFLSKNLFFYKQDKKRDKKTRNPLVLKKNEENFSLNKAELEFLLLLVKRSTFVGEQIEDVYNVVYKLQQQYLQVK